MAETQRSHADGDVDKRPGDSVATKPDLSKFEGYEGTPSKLGGRVLPALLVLAIISWAVALVQIVRLPVQEVETSMEMAFWVAIACASGISAFLLGVWKAHRS